MNNELLNKYYKTKEIIKNQYNKSDEKAQIILDTLSNDFLDQVITDSKNVQFTDFYKKYKLDSKMFEYTDFTQSEVKKIISETPLTERDRKMATLRFVELKSEEDIAGILVIDKKTVHNNLPKISYLLKCTCNKLYNK